MHLSMFGHVSLYGHEHSLKSGLARPMLVAKVWGGARGTSLCLEAAALCCVVRESVRSDFLPTSGVKAKFAKLRVCRTL